MELATYKITSEWISGAQNKTADCLSRLVKLPHDRQATVQMLTTTNHDGLAFNTRSKTACLNITEDLTPPPQANTVTPDITAVKDTPDAMLKLLTEDRIHALLQMQRTDPFCKHISKHLSKGKAPKCEADLFLHIKGLLNKHVINSNQKFLALVIAKGWNCTVPMEVHDKLGHIYCLMKCQYYWKGMNKDIGKYMAKCTLCCRGKAKVQSYPSQMTEIPE